LLKLKSWKVKPTQIESDLLTPKQDIGMDQCQKQEAQQQQQTYEVDVQTLARIGFLSAKEKDPLLQVG
jgi:hypothetical protein